MANRVWIRRVGHIEYDQPSVSVRQIQVVAADKELLSSSGKVKAAYEGRTGGIRHIDYDQTVDKGAVGSVLYHLNVLHVTPEDAGDIVDVIGKNTPDTNEACDKKITGYAQTALRDSTFS
jgi:hypothetical protein